MPQLELQAARFGGFAEVTQVLRAQDPHGCEHAVEAGSNLREAVVGKLVAEHPGDATGLAEAVLPLPEIGPWLRRVTEGGA